VEGLLKLSLRPLSSRIGSRLLHRPLQSIASETVELAPANRRYRAPAIALPDEIERVTFFHEWTPQRDDIRLGALQHLSEGEDLHAATVVFRVDDVLVADGCVYGLWELSVITREKRRPLLSGEVEELKEAQLCTTHAGSVYFGDWLTVDIPIELMAQRRGMPALSVTNQSFGHEPDYRRRFELPRPPRPHSIIHADSLWIVKDNDNGMTTDRLERYGILRDRVRRPNAGGPRRVFIDRGSWGQARGLGNRDEVLQSLTARGFEAIYPETMTVDEISGALSSVEICVGIEGSSMCHAALLMPPGSCLVAIVPDDRFLTFLKWFTDAFDGRYAYVVGKRPAPDAPHLTVDVARLNATLDLVERAL
jgi:Glycosyltransferase 61